MQIIKSRYKRVIKEEKGGSVVSNRVVVKGARIKYGNCRSVEERIKSSCKKGSGSGRGRELYKEWKCF